MTVRDRIHIKYCLDIGACDKIGGAGDKKNCLNLDYLLDKVEDDRAHAEAVRIRDAVASDPVYRPKWKRGMLEAADLVDPYEERDGQLVRKSDGKPVTV